MQTRLSSIAPVTVGGLGGTFGNNPGAEGDGDTTVVGITLSEETPAVCLSCLPFVLRYNYYFKSGIS
jgi:hypothetical protein